LHRLGLPIMKRLAIAGALVIAWPPLGSGIETGNISPLVTGLTLLSLVTWRRRPILSGTALGWAVALKPTAAIALALLPLFGRLRDPARRQSWWTVGIASAWCIGLLLWGAPYVRDMAASIDPQVAALGNTSIYRVLYLCGAEVPPVPIMATVGIITAWLAWRSPADDRTIVCLVSCMALLSMPIEWRFTLLLALPIQCHALAQALARFRSSRNHRDLLVLAWVVCAGLIVTFSESYGDASLWVAALKPVLVATPLVALALLTRFVLRTP
jgi:uncharacterized membrane protein